MYTNNEDSSAILSVDLLYASRPVLQFWSHYAFTPNRDFGFVEVSQDYGSTWTRWYAVTGLGGTNWYPVQLDLTPYAGTLLMVRFRLVSGAFTTFAGWDIDDVSVADYTVPGVYPFYDSMNGTVSASNWLASGWFKRPAARRPTRGRVGCPRLVTMATTPDLTPPAVICSR